MDDINSELDIVSSKLDQSAALQSRFDRWAGNWLGGKKAQAHKEAAAEIQARNSASHSKVKEVFQQEKYDSIGRTWKKAGMYLCTDPSISCNDVFDPNIQIDGSRWAIDFSLTGIDAEGWTYAYDFAALNKNGVGERSPKWNTYARRRKWRFDDKSSGNEQLNKVRERSHARATNKPQQVVSGTNKITYVRRNNDASNLQETGFSNNKAGFTRGGNKQQLDAESAADLQNVQANDDEINAGIDSIGSTLDTLAGISHNIKDEAIEQNAKLDIMDNKMQKGTEKQTVVNARQRYLLK